ncbi:MAG: peptidyl-prolyl cis-trans isomerase [Bryobacterales bacterium]|nr:peptidyl-prolyl cis-trans isomerase [Bryobacterales bacterium]
MPPNSLRYHKRVKFRTAILALTAVPALLAQTSMPTAPAPKFSGPVATPAPAAPPTDPNKVVLNVGSEQMTAAQFDALVDALPAQYQSYARGPQKRQFVETVVQLKLLSQSAAKAGLDKTSKMQEQLKFQKENLLAQSMFENIQQNTKVDDAAVQAYYNGHKNEYESVKAKHILIRVKGAPMPGAEGKPELTEEQALAKAQDVVKRLKAGGDFAATAKTDSDDTGSAQQGGDLGEFHRGMMVPPFEEAAFALKIGEISEPVKSPFGYHVILVQSHTSKPMAEVRPEIEKALRPEVAKKEVQSMREKASVKIDDAFFGPAVAPEAAPSPAAPVVK